EGRCERECVRSAASSNRSPSPVVAKGYRYESLPLSDTGLLAQHDRKVSARLRLPPRVRATFVATAGACGEEIGLVRGVAVRSRCQLYVRAPRETARSSARFINAVPTPFPRTRG